MLAQLMNVLGVSKDDPSNILLNTAKGAGAAMFAGGMAKGVVQNISDGAAATTVLGVSTAQLSQLAVAPAVGEQIKR